MQYENITRGVFIDRPNRFVAHVDIDGKIETVHVKNTGRCRELLLPGAEVYLTEPGIDIQGLIPKSRLYVHLSSDVETAKKVGSRHGKPVIYQVDCKRWRETDTDFIFQQIRFG